MARERGDDQNFRLNGRALLDEAQQRAERRRRDLLLDHRHHFVAEHHFVDAESGAAMAQCRAAHHLAQCPGRPPIIGGLGLPEGEAAPRRRRESPRREKGIGSRLIKRVEHHGDRLEFCFQNGHGKSAHDQYSDHQ